MMVDGELKGVSDLKVNDVVMGGAKIKCVVKYECEFVYNFVLDAGHIMTVNGVEACTLGHNFKESGVIQHEYFGTNKVTDDLMKMKGWTRGLVTLHSGSFKRYEDSNMVEGLIGV